MYINNIHILIYVVIALIGGVAGLISGWCNQRLPDEKSIFSKKIFAEFRPNWLLALISSILYIVLLFRFGIHNNFIENIALIEYLILIPMLLSVFVIDKKLTIIPNRLNLTMFEVGLIVTFIIGLNNFTVAINSILGMLIGAGIFFIIGLVGSFFAGKEAMGMGDVKLMGALGLFFGMINTIAISVMAFLIAAIISVGILLMKKSKDGYIPFGPFIVVASFIAMIVPSDILIYSLLKIFSLGLY